MKCNKCNHELASGKFCGNCGIPLQIVEIVVIEEVGDTQSK